MNTPVFAYYVIAPSDNPHAGFISISDAREWADKFDTFKQNYRIETHDGQIITR